MFTTEKARDQMAAPIPTSKESYHCVEVYWRAPAGTLEPGVRMIAARDHDTANHTCERRAALSHKPPCSYSHAPRPTEAPSAVQPTKLRTASARAPVLACVCFHNHGIVGG